MFPELGDRHLGPVDVLPEILLQGVVVRLADGQALFGDVGPERGDVDVQARPGLLVRRPIRRSQVKNNRTAEKL